MDQGKAVQVTPIRALPAPRPGTRVRIIGPLVINGMRVWRVFNVTRMPHVQIGPDCLSYDEALERAKETADGKAVIWFGNYKLTPTPYYGSEQAVESDEDPLR